MLQLILPETAILKLKRQPHRAESRDVGGGKGKLRTALGSYRGGLVPQERGRRQRDEVMEDMGVDRRDLRLAESSERWTEHVDSVWTT